MFTSQTKGHMRRAILLSLETVFWRAVSIFIIQIYGKQNTLKFDCLIVFNKLFHVQIFLTTLLF